MNEFAKRVWKEDLSNKLFLRRKLMLIKMNEGEKLEDFLSKFDHLLCQLKSSGTEVKEEDAICTLLLALPKLYETVVTVLENMAIETLDLNYVKTRLKIDFEKRKENNGNQNEIVKEPAVFISNKSIRCHNCGESRHIKRYCKKPSQNQPSYNDVQGNNFRGNKSRRGLNPRSMHRGGNASNRFKDHQNWNNQSHFKYHNQPIRRGDYVEKNNTREDNICFISSRDNNLETVNKEDIFFVDSGSFGK